MRASVQCLSFKVYRARHTDMRKREKWYGRTYSRLPWRAGKRDLAFLRAPGAQEHREKNHRRVSREKPGDREYEFEILATLALTERPLLSLRNYLASHVGSP